jgi:uncharacterized protein (UPF0147 family)
MISPNPIMEAPWWRAQLSTSCVATYLGDLDAARKWKDHDLGEIQSWNEGASRRRKKMLSRLVRNTDSDRMAALLQMVPRAGWQARQRNQARIQRSTNTMSTLAVVEEILRETAVPMSVREIVERAGARLPSKSKTPDTVVARDLSMDLKRKGEDSTFVRSSPGRYTLRALHAAELLASQQLALQGAAASQPQAADTASATALSSSLLTERAAAMPTRKPVTAAKSEDGFAIER